MTHGATRKEESGTTGGRSIHPVGSEEISHWDVATDVLVVGFGCAGAAAALEAQAAGGDVLVAERAGGPGGTSALAGGEIYLGGGTDIQRACGFEDSPEQMYAFLNAALGPEPDTDKLALYCEQSVAHFEWLCELGVPFKPSLWDKPAYVPPTDDGLMWLGEKSHPFCEIAAPAPRGHRPQAGHFGGHLLMEKLGEAVAARGIQSSGDTTVERLVTGSDGDVVGVIGRRFGERLTIRARRGVVLATGGFVYNDEMLRLHAPALLGRSKIGTEHDDGRGIRMAQALGAAVRRMDVGEAAIWVSPAIMARGIIVNAQGQRFINEDTYPGRIGQVALYRQQGEAFMVFDQEIYDGLSRGARLGQEPAWVAETVAELEEEMGLPERALQTTVDLYNEHAADGRDPLFGKQPEWLKPLRPPFAAIDARGRAEGDGTGTGPAAGGFLVFTLGGLDTTTEGQVRSVDGRTIPGLFAAGRTAAGLSGWGYISGTSLGEGMLFGRRAGRAAALRR